MSFSNTLQIRKTLSDLGAGSSTSMFANATLYGLTAESNGTGGRLAAGVEVMNVRQVQASFAFQLAGAAAGTEVPLTLVDIKAARQLILEISIQNQVLLSKTLGDLAKSPPFFQGSSNATLGNNVPCFMADLGFAPQPHAPFTLSKSDTIKIEIFAPAAIAWVNAADFPLHLELIGEAD